MIASLQVVIFFVFYIAIFGLSLWALIDLLRRPATAFPQAGKRTKGFWGAIVGVATAVSFSVIPIPGRAAPPVVPRPARRGRRDRVPGRREAGRDPVLGRPRTRTPRTVRSLRRLVSVPDIGAAAVPLARVLRGGLVESVHVGHVVVLAPDGSRAVRPG